MELSSIGYSVVSSSCPACAGNEGSAAGAGAAVSGTGQNQELSDEEKREVRELKKRDKEVKAHEAAHVAAGGAYVRGGATYEYQVGPDGRKYAVGGEVAIDSSPVPDDPRATIRKMQRVKAAALAPAQPSGTDRAVAAKASMEAAKAQAELAKSRQSGEIEGRNDTVSAKAPPVPQAHIDIIA
ncbi:MAG: hypothetical protein JXA71_19865 [Chitinispirillaceae bacterium]|nr:hypothetical protein [Chitinispirillaceae bacterium]